MVASGRSAWIGWAELVSEHVDELALQHTAMVIRDVGAAGLGGLEAGWRSWGGAGRLAGGTPAARAPA